MTLQERARELTHAWVLCVIVIAGAARTDGGKGVGGGTGGKDIWSRRQRGEFLIIS